MLRELSIQDARRTFDHYARLEPQLVELWRRCEQAGPVVDTDEGHEDDCGDEPPLDSAAGWCAEQFFLEHVKPDLTELVGMHRPDGPDELRGSKAYDVAYATLFLHALKRSCACCSPRARTTGAAAPSPV